MKKYKYQWQLERKLTMTSSNNGNGQYQQYKLPKAAKPIPGSQSGSHEETQLPMTSG